MTKECGSCSLCCKLVPVKEIEKPRNTWCEHCTKPGCAIYADRPRSCVKWSCVWLLSDLPESLKPRVCHVVIDPVAEEVRWTIDGGEPEAWFACQIWVDPTHPNAWNNPELLGYLATLCAQEKIRAVIVRGGRYRPDQSFLLFAPHFTKAGWIVREPQPQDRAPFNESQRWEAVKLGYATEDAS